MDLSGASAFVTGGGSGLGAATAKALAAKGAKVTVFDLNKDGAESWSDASCARPRCAARCTS